MPKVNKNRLKYIIFYDRIPHEKDVFICIIQVQEINQ